MPPSKNAPSLDAAPSSSPPTDAGPAPRDEPDVAQWALQWLGARYSVGPKDLGEPAPDSQELERCAAIAARAPDHGLLRPFRFVQVADAQRDRLSRLFEQAARRRGQDAEQVHAAARRAYNGAALVALVVRIEDGIEDVPASEQWLSAGGALTNFLNALHLMGFGAKTLSGTSVRDPQIRAAFCAEGEQLAAWVVIGTPRRQPRARAAPQTAPRLPVLTAWAPPLDPGADDAGSGPALAAP